MRGGHASRGRLVAALLGLDPIGQFYTWLGGISSVGIVLLLVLTSVAVLAIFRRNDHGLGRWKTLVAPGLGLIGLAAFAVLVEPEEEEDEDEEQPASSSAAAIIAAVVTRRI